MIYREIENPERRTQFNFHLRLRKWVDPQPLDEYSPDCPSCLRGRDHTITDHERSLRRVREASRA